MTLSASPGAPFLHNPLSRMRPLSSDRVRARTLCSGAIRANYDSMSPFDFRRGAPDALRLTQDRLRTNGLPFVLSVAERSRSTEAGSRPAGRARNGRATAYRKTL